MNPEQKLDWGGDAVMSNSLEIEEANMDADPNSYTDRDDAPLDSTDAYETLIWLLAIVFCLEVWTMAIAFIR